MLLSRAHCRDSTPRSAAPSLEGVRADLDNSALALAFAARSLPKLQRVCLLSDYLACLAAAELHAVAAVNRLYCRGTMSGRALMCVLCTPARSTRRTRLERSSNVDRPVPPEADRLRCQQRRLPVRQRCQRCPTSTPSAWTSSWGHMSWQLPPAGSGSWQLNLCGNHGLQGAGACTCPLTSWIQLRTLSM